jgi:hypothetical protein
MSSLTQFLIASKNKGYATNEPPTQEADHSFSNRHSDGEWSFHDNWFGGEPFGGREVVFKNNKPYWMMVYYGSDSMKAEKTIDTLRKALRELPEELPARGPKELVDDDYRYTNTWEGTIDQFKGHEEISYKGERVYFADYSGGLVDQKEN